MTTGARVVVGRIARSRNLRRVFGAYLLFNAAELGTWVAVLLYAYQRTGPASVGLVALIQLIPSALAAPPAAALGDRYPRHRVLFGGYVVQAAAVALTAATMVVDAPIAIVYGSAALAATSMVITRPTQSALLPSLVWTPEELTASNGTAGVVEGIGILTGPLIAAVVLIDSTPAAVFVLAAIACAAAAVIVLGVQVAVRPTLSVDAPGSVQRNRRSQSFMTGLRVLAGDPDARVVVGLLSAYRLILGATDVLFVLLALETFGMGAPGVGVLSAALGAGAILGGVITFGFIGRSRLAFVAAAGAITWGLTFATATLLASPSLATALIVAGGAGLAIMNVAGRTILQRSIRDEVLARVFGLQEGLAQAALAAGALLVPVLVSIVGLTGAALICATILPVGVALTWSRLTALDRRTVVPIRAIGLLRLATVLAGLPAPPLEAVARRATWLTVPAGTAVIRQGDPGDRFYVLASGRVRVEQDGRVLRDLHDEGDGFGEIALLLDVPRTATVTTVEDSELLAIDRATFLGAMTDVPSPR